MKKILVTGGCGYIGSHTLIELIGKDYHYLSVDSLVNSSEEALDHVAKITGKRPENTVLDLCDLEKLQDFFRKNTDIDAVIHFAALKSVPQSVANPILYYNNNLLSLNNLLSCCKEFGIKNFIFSSSCSIYGNVESLPVNEQTAWGRAESPYAATKQMGERILEDFCKVHPDFRAIALRYFNPVGSHFSGWNGENPINPPSNLVPVITQTAAGIRETMTVFGSDYPTRDGSCVRDYIHVTDIADAHILALEYLEKNQNESNFEVFNLGTGQGVSVLEAIAAFEKVSGQKLNYQIGARRAGDVAAIYSDSSLAEKKLAWKPRFGIEDMMSSAWKWQQYIK